MDITMYINGYKWIDLWQWILGDPLDISRQKCPTTAPALAPFTTKTSQPSSGIGARVSTVPVPSGKRLHNWLVVYPPL